MTGLEILRLRRDSGLAATEFAELCGVAERTVYRWEACHSGEIPPTVGTTKRVLEAFGKATAGKKAAVAEALRKSGWKAAWASLFNVRGG